MIVSRARAASLLLAFCALAGAANAQPLTLPDNVIGVAPGGPGTRQIELEIASPLGPAVYRTTADATDWTDGVARQLDLGAVACATGTIRGRAANLVGAWGAWSASRPATFRGCPLPAPPILSNPVP